MSAKRRYPLDYRLEEVDYLMRRWRVGASLIVVGVGSSGKTNLLQHVLEPTVRQHFLKQDAGAIMPIVIDANLLGPEPAYTDRDADALRCWSLYELMLHQLYLGLYPFSNFTQEAIDKIMRAYHALHDGRNPNLMYMAPRYLELAVDAVMQSDIRIIFIFDEFEETLQRIPGEAFRTLRALRDQYKRLLSYMIFARAPLFVLLRQFELSAAELEPFVELFSDDVLFLGSFGDRDARRFLSDLNTRYDHPLTEEVLSALQRFTGGHAGLMRATFHCLREQHSQMMNTTTLDVDDIDRFLTSPALVSEAQTIWKGLSAAEREVLSSVARAASVSIDEEVEAAIHLLMRRRLLIIDHQTGSLIIHPPIFARFLQLH